MKKLFLVGALALSTVFAASAQDLEGKWFVGGQLGFKSTKIKGVDDKANEYTILPTIGTFISSDVAVGASLGYKGTKEGKAKTNAIVIAPLARKYWNIAGGFNVFGQAALPIAFGDKTTGLEGAEKFKTLDIHLELAPGFDYIFNDKFSLETSFTVLRLGYAQSKQGEAKTDSFGFNANQDDSSYLGEFKVGFKMFF